MKSQEDFKEQLIQMNKKQEEMQQQYSQALEKQREEFEKKMIGARREQDEVFIQKEPAAVDEEAREIELRKKL